MGEGSGKSKTASFAISITRKSIFWSQGSEVLAVSVLLGVVNRPPRRENLATSRLARQQAH